MSQLIISGAKTSFYCHMGMIFCYDPGDMTELMGFFHEYVPLCE